LGIAKIFCNFANTCWRAEIGALECSEQTKNAHRERMKVDKNKQTWQTREQFSLYGKRIKTNKPGKRICFY